MDIFASLTAKIKGKEPTIVFPEGTEPRILTAALRLADEQLVRPLLLGDEQAVKAAAATAGLKWNDAVMVINPQTYPAEKYATMVEAFVDRRKGKNTAEEAEKMLRDEIISGRCWCTWDWLTVWFLARFIPPGIRCGRPSRLLRRSRASTGQVARLS